MEDKIRILIVTGKDCSMLSMVFLCGSSLQPQCLYWYFLLILNVALPLTGLPKVYLKNEIQNNVHRLCNNKNTFILFMLLLNLTITGWIVLIIVPQYMNSTATFSTLKLLFFSFSSCLTIERSIVFKTMDRQCESFSRIFCSATGLDKRFIFIRNTWTSSSIDENSEISKRDSETENGNVCLVNWPGFRCNYRREGL